MTDFNYDNLFSGDFPIVTEEVTVESGQNLERGSVLGIVTATGKAKIVDSTATDGSQDPKSVLADDVDATGGDVVSLHYLTGEFNQNELTVGGTDTVAQHKAAMRALSMFQQPTRTTEGTGG